VLVSGLLNVPFLNDFLSLLNRARGMKSTLSQEGDILMGAYTRKSHMVLENHCGG
jgi:hypothetical protein